MSSDAEYGAPPFVVRNEMVKKWSGDRVGSSMWPPPKSVCATIATPEVTTSVQKESSSGAGAPLPFGHCCNCRPRTPGSRCDASELVDGVLEGRSREQPDTDEASGIDRRVLL